MDIRGIFRRLYCDNLEGARRLVRHDESGRLVCLSCHDKPCLKACRRKTVLGAPVPIPGVLEEIGPTAGGN
jgi:hypothetical protein